MENNTLKKKKPLILRIFTENSYCWLSVLCTAGIMMLVYYCFNLFPFGDTTILRMDLYHQYGPLFAELYDRITQGKSLIYSWNTGLGAPFLGNFYNYLSSPVGIIIMLLLGHENMPEAIAGMILAKAALAAGAFTFYLKGSQKKHDFSTAAFGILYALCGWFVAYYWNVMWVDATIFFPLVMLGIERIIKDKKPLTYIISLALTLLTSYYMGYMTCIFSVIWFFVYYFSNYSINSLMSDADYTIKLNGKKKYSTLSKIKSNNFLRSGFTFAFSSAIAGALVAFSLIPVYICLKSCSATSGTFPEEMRTYFSVFDFLANHLASVDPTIRSSGIDVLPNVFCGMGTLILVPLFLFSKEISLKEKVANVFTLGFLYYSFNVNFLNYIWHGFHFPNDLPYRFSFMYVFVLLVMAYKAYTHLYEFTGRQILGAGCAVIFAIILIEKIGSKNVIDNTVIISLIFVVTYTHIFYLLKDKKKQQSAISVILLCCVIAEIACANTDNYSMTQIKGTYTDDYSTFLQTKDKLDKSAGNDWYRMELTYNRARMDPAWFGYNGISTFSSMAYEKMSNMQHNLGLYSNYINSYTYYVQTPVYNMMNSLRYVVDNDPCVYIDQDYFTQVVPATDNTFAAYYNNYYLTPAVAVSSDVKEWYTGYSNPFITQEEWFHQTTGVKGELFKRMTVTNVSVYNVNNIDTGLETGDIYFTRTSLDEGSVTFFIAPTSSGYGIDDDYLDDEDLGDGEYYDYNDTVTDIDESDSENLDGTNIFDDLGITEDDEVTATEPVDKTGWKHCYLFVESSSFDSLTIRNGNRTDTQNINEPYIYDLGLVNPNESVQVTITIPEGGNDYGYMNFYPYYVDDDVLNEGYSILEQNQMKVTSYEETEIKGTINAQKSGVVFTSIPYDKGWTVKVDGKVLDEDEVFALQDAYLCFNIEKGEHTIEFSFEQRGLKIGACASLVALITLIIAVILFRKKIGPAIEEKHQKAHEKALADHEEALAEEERKKMASLMEEIDFSDVYLFDKKPDDADSEEGEDNPDTEPEEKEAETEEEAEEPAEEENASEEEDKTEDPAEEAEETSDEDDSEEAKEESSDDSADTEE